MLINLINNIAFLIALVAIGQIVLKRFPNNALNRQVSLGLLFGSVALLGMLNPVTFAPGLIFDGRSIVLSVAGVVGGIVTAGIAAVMAAIYRYHLGGIGAPVGLVVIVVSSLLGVLARQWWLQRQGPPSILQYLTLAVVVQLVQLATFTQIPDQAGFLFIKQAWWVLLLLYPPATIFLCQIFLDHEQQLENQRELQAVQEAAMRERSMLRTLIDTLPDLIWLKDSKGIYLACNHRFEQFFGASEREIVGKTDFDFVDTALGDFFRANDHAAMEKNGPTVNEEEITFATDGHHELLQTIKMPMRDENGQLIGILGIGNDITQRNKAERALENSEKQLRLVLEGAELGFWDWDIAAGTVTRNERWATMLGYSHEDNQQMTHFIHPDDHSLVWDSINAVLEGRSSKHRLEYRMLSKDGSVIWILDQANVMLRDANGKPLRMCGTHTDITPRKQAEEVLCKSEARFRSLFNNMTEGVALHQLVRDESGQPVDYIILDVNPAFTTHTELSIKDVIGKTATQAYGVSPFLDQYAQVAISGQPLLFETFFSPLGKTFSISAVSPAPEQFATIFRNISERVQLEQALRQASERFQAIIEASPIPMALNDDELNITYLNDAFVKTFGYTLTDISTIADWWLKAYPDPTYRAQVQQEWQDHTEAVMLRGDRFEPMEVQITTRSGHGRTVLVAATALPEGLDAVHLVTLIDITERKQIELELQRSREQLRATLTAQQLADAKLRENQALLSAMFNQAAVGLAHVDTMSSRFLWANPRYEQILGRSLEDMQTHSFFDMTHPDDVALSLDFIDKLKKGLSHYSIEKRYIRPDQSVVWVMLTVSPLWLPGEKPSTHVAVVQDISERKRDEEQLRLSKQVFDTTIEAVMITDSQRKIVDVNDAFSKITGFSKTEVLGKSPSFLKSGLHDAAFYAAMWKSLTSSGHWSGELWNQRKDRELYPEWLTISAITDNNDRVTHYVGISSDITLLKEHEKKLEYIAHYDALTGIPNRVLLADRMQQALAQTRRDHTLLAICYLDLDGFKPINDQEGHSVGDKVLSTTAHRINNVLRGSDTVARLGGDEFVILLLGIESLSDCHRSLERLIDTIQAPIQTSSRALQVTASIGVTLYPEDNNDADTLLRHADQAMYIAKQSGKNRYHLFDSKEDDRQNTQRQQKLRIAQGLKADEFRLYFQPKVNLSTGRLMGAEALIRWQHPERGLLSPAEFLPFIENSELEIQIGEWVALTALKQLEFWQQQNRTLELSINIAAYHLQSGDFLDRLAGLLNDFSQIDSTLLQIEILETVALADIAKISEIISKCSALGVSFALDDFGTGYSSLDYLRRLPVTTLKIDQSFVRDMLEDKGDLAIVKGIIALAEAFNCTTVAEGVETDAHVQVLRELECLQGQGYGIARPMSVEKFEEWMQLNGF